MSEANAELGPVSLRSVFMVHLATYVYNERFFKCLILIYLVVNYLKYYLIVNVLKVASSYTGSALYIMLPWILIQKEIQFVALVFM